MFFFIILALICILLSVEFYWTRRRLFKLTWGLPGPLYIPFIGSAYLFFQGDPAVIANRFMNLFDKYPEVCKVWMGKDLYFLISKPEYLEIILNSPGAFEKNTLYDFVKPVLGDGLLTSSVPIWKRHRKMISPSLNQKILNEYPDIINRQCSILIEKLENNCGKEIDHCHYLTNCATDIIAETIFGVSIDAQITDAKFSELIDSLLEVFFIKIFRLFYHSEYIFSLTKHFKTEQETGRRFKALARRLIEKKREQLANEVDVEEDAKIPFFPLIVKKLLQNELSQSEVEDETMTFLLAGTDTNATTSSFVLTLLGMHQKIQDKVYEEAMEVLGPEGPVTLANLPKLKYTERVLKESLRVFPGAPFVGRKAQEDINLGDFIIPKGSQLGLGYLHLHRNETYWPNPLQFDPDRFLPERSLNRHPYAYLPFSGGPRNCIGMKYSFMILKIITVMIIRRFKVSNPIKSIEDIELTTNIVLKPKNGFRLTFELR